MPTLEGIIFIPLALYFFFFRPQLLFPLLIISTVFEASSVVSAGSFGIQPYYCIAPLFVVRFLFVRVPTRKQIWVDHPFTKLWVIFAMVSVLSAAMLPVIFKGTSVFDPRISVDENFLSPARLSPQLTNIVQSGFLILNVLVVIASTRLPRSTEKAHRAFMQGAYIVVAIILVQSLFFWFGLPFPIKLLNNNPGYTLANINASTLRPNGSFTEPSMAGAIIASYVAAFLWKYFAGRQNILGAAIAAVACLLVASTSSFIAILIVFALLVLAYPVVRLPWYFRIGRLKRFSIFLIAAAGLTLLLIIPTFRNLLVSQTLEKSGSDSALVRLGADAFALNLVLQTHGLGVGLGSNRPSSFVTSLLSQVGVIGFVLFIWAAWATLWPLPKKDRWIGMAALGLLLSMAFGLPDLSFPFLWILFALAAQSKSSEVIVSQPRQLEASRDQSSTVG
jgi:hypothetical protein